MHDLTRCLGPLMLLRLRELPVLVASSADVAREIMRANNLAFATRPMSPTGKILLGEGSYGLVFAPYGDGWRQLRRICSMELFSARRVRSFRAVREEEVRRLLRSVASSSGSASSPVNLSKMVSAYVADASVRAIIGISKGSRPRGPLHRSPLLHTHSSSIIAQGLPPRQHQRHCWPAACLASRER